jgi:hypothetical protein
MSMNLPSIKTIREGLNIDNATARTVRFIMEAGGLKSLRKLEPRMPIDRGSGQPFELDAYLTQFYHLPPLAQVQLDMLDILLDAHGVEQADGPGESYFEYLNTGDTYARTVLLDSCGRFRINSVGDEIERRKW